MKFDTEQLPAILNALTTDNGGNKLVLEVAVRNPIGYVFVDKSLRRDGSNIWVRTLCGVLLWMVSGCSRDYAKTYTDMPLSQQVPRVSSVVLLLPIPVPQS